MLIPEITQENVYLFIPRKIGVLAARYVEEHSSVSPKEALLKFYRSTTYKQLADESSKLWHNGDVALYEEFLDSERSL